MNTNTDQFEESRLALAKAEVFDDFSYGEIWASAELKMKERVENCVHLTGDISEEQFLEFFKDAATETIIAIANDLDCDVEDHINVTVTSDGKGMKVSVTPVSSIGDIFCMLYSHDDHERV